MHQVSKGIGQDMKIRLFKVKGQKGGWQVVRIYARYSKCIFGGTKRACTKFIKEL